METEYTNVISGETQTKEAWIQETAEQGYHLDEKGEVDQTPVEYFNTCVNIGNLVTVFK